MVAERMKRPYADFSDGVTKQATVPEPSTVLGLAGTAPGLVVEADGTPVIVLPGPPDRAAAALAAGARGPGGPSPPRPGHAAAAEDAALLRPRRVPGRAGLPGGRWRRRRARGDDLRPQLRDPRRPRRRAERRGAAARARARALGAAGAVPLLDRRAGRGGDRARPLPRARLVARDGGVVHGRARRRRADGDPGLERRRHGRHRRVRERGQDRRAGRPGRPDRAARRRLGRGRRGDGAGGARAARRRRRRLGHGRRRPGRRHRGEAGRARLLPRRDARGRAGAASSASPATATRSAGARSWRRCTWCGAFWNRIETKPRRDGR